MAGCTRRRLFVLTLLALAMSSMGCFVELAGGYYPVVNGGSRVENKAYMFGIHAGVALKVKKIRASLGQGGDVLAANYEDPTGKGKVGHLAGFYGGRLDYMASRLSGFDDNGNSTWLDLSVGGSFGKGFTSVEYNASDVPSKDDRKVSSNGSTWSAYAGPSIHYSMAQEGDLLITFAPSVHNSVMAAHDPLRAYGGQIRVVLALGVDPPSVDWGDVGFVKLMQSGGDAGGSGLDEDMREHNKNQERNRERERERQDREKKEKERKRLEEGN